MSGTDTLLAPPAAAVPRTLGLAAAGITAVGGIEIAVGAPPGVVLAMVVSPLIAGAHVAALTLPGLLVAQGLLGLSGTPASTARALEGGLRHGTALLLACLPLVLFFGASLGSPRIAVGLSGASFAAALGATLLKTARALAAAESDRVAVGRACYAAWTVVAGLVGGASMVDAMSALGGAP